MTRPHHNDIIPRLIGAEQRPPISGKRHSISDTHVLIYPVARAHSYQSDQDRTRALSSKASLSEQSYPEVGYPRAVLFGDYYHPNARAEARDYPDNTEPAVRGREFFR